MERNEAAMKLIALIFVLIYISACVEAFDNIECEEQLNKFENALEKREFWALRCEFVKICLESFN